MINDEGKRLALFFERENLTGTEVAKELKLHEADISRYVTGKRKTPITFVKALHLKYGLNYSWFFHGVGSMKYKGAEKRNIMSDLTDIHASIAMLMQSQDSMRKDLHKLIRDFYAQKHEV